MQQIGLPRKALVTAALPYANGDVHLGHLAGAYLPADTYVRFLRAMGTEAVFVCGSDEHGVPIALAAEKAGVTPKDIIDRYHAANDAAFRAARVEFDIYGRTSDPAHHELTQYFFKRLLERGHVVKRPYQQLYCERCGRFLPDRYVEGRCHFCGEPGARGDQCDACGRVLDPLKLIEPRCKICGASPGVRQTMHWFLKLEDFSSQLANWLDSHPEWRPNVLEGARGWLAEGLRERAITRDLAWGVKVPLPEAEGKVLYVWFDAPIGYLTFSKQWAERNGKDWREWWCDPATPVVHFIGKDNIPFHTITWPAMILGVADGTVLPSAVVANEFLNIQDETLQGAAAGLKFSKSQGRIIRIADFAQQFGSDALRYYLTAIAPESSDSVFSWDGFRSRYGELADVLGNLCHRALAFATRYFEGRFPDVGEPSSADRELLARLSTVRQEVASDLARWRMKLALGKVMDLARAGNRHFDERKPWETRKTDRADCAKAIATSLSVVRSIASLIEPFMPEASGRLARILGQAAPPLGKDSWRLIRDGELLPGARLGEPQVLFPKQDDAEFASRVRACIGAERRT